jgi:hypothetical protein
VHEDPAQPVTAVRFGLLTSIETATVLLVYVPVTCFADKRGKWFFVPMIFVFFSYIPQLFVHR